MKPCLVVLVICLSIAGCTRPNEAICCVDEADCADLGIAGPKLCGDGLVCRGNQCIAQRCDDASDCDAAAPFCQAEGRCAETCAEDMQCPGFGGAVDNQFCEAGSCVACRTEAECDTAAPICEQGSCRGCRADAECGSGVCADDGQCAVASDIAYAAPAGSGTECSMAMPCSLGDATTLAPLRRYVVVASGDYATAGSLLLRGTLDIRGATPRPSITNTMQGPIMVIEPNSNATLRNLEFTGATGTNTEFPFGDGVECGSADATLGARTLTVIDSVFRNNESNGIAARACTFTALRSEFSDNDDAGVRIFDSPVTIDSCIATNNTRDGMLLDAGEFTVVNSIVARNPRNGMNFYADAGNSRFEFNTVVDNGTGITGAGTAAATTSARNNILARNSTLNVSCACSTEGSIVLGSTITSLAFRSPDVAPYDYHLLAGSEAIDAAVGGQPNDHDIDGDARPNGPAADVGADEYVP